MVIESVCGELVRLELGLKSWERLSLYNAQELFFCIFSYCCAPLPWLNHTDFSPRVWIIHHTSSLSWLLFAVSYRIILICRFSACPSTWANQQNGILSCRKIEETIPVDIWLCTKDVRAWVIGLRPPNTSESWCRWTYSFLVTIVVGYCDRWFLQNDDYSLSFIDMGSFVAHPQYYPQVLHH